jgi:hypothetical protein
MVSTYKSTWRHNREQHRHHHRRDNLRSRTDELNERNKQGGLLERLLKFLFHLCRARCNKFASCDLETVRQIH